MCTCNIHCYTATSILSNFLVSWWCVSFTPSQTHAHTASSFLSLPSLFFFMKKDQTIQQATSHLSCQPTCMEKNLIFSLKRKKKLFHQPSCSSSHSRAGTQQPYSGPNRFVLFFFHEGKAYKTAWSLGLVWWWWTRRIALEEYFMHNCWRGKLTSLIPSLSSWSSSLYEPQPTP